MGDASVSGYFVRLSDIFCFPSIHYLCISINPLDGWGVCDRSGQWRQALAVFGEPGTDEFWDPLHEQLMVNLHPKSWDCVLNFPDISRLSVTVICTHKSNQNKQINNIKSRKLRNRSTNQQINEETHKQTNKRTNKTHSFQIPWPFPDSAIHGSQDMALSEAQSPSTCWGKIWSDNVLKVWKRKKRRFRR